MGFEKNKTYKLDFAGTPLEGLEIRAHGLSMRQALALTELADLADIKGIPTPEELEKITKVFTMFAAKIVSWNVEDQGQPVPPSADALLDLDLDTAMAAVQAWQDAVSGVPAPLEPPSSAGSRWVGEPIPMEIPSPNLSTSSTPA